MSQVVASETETGMLGAGWGVLLEAVLREKGEGKEWAEEGEQRCSLEKVVGPPHREPWSEAGLSELC